MLSSRLLLKSFSYYNVVPKIKRYKWSYVGIKIVQKIVVTCEIKNLSFSYPCVSNFIIILIFLSLFSYTLISLSLYLSLSFFLISFFLSLSQALFIFLVLCFFLSLILFISCFLSLSLYLYIFLPLSLSLSLFIYLSISLSLYFSPSPLFFFKYLSNSIVLQENDICDCS